MSDGNRNGYGDNATDDGIARRTEGAFDRHDDSNRGPLDRAANAVTGGSGGVGGALHRDDPNRGPFDRAENTLGGHDDPNRGPLDRAANAITGGSGGVDGALHRDDPNRVPFDRTENTLRGHDDPNRGPLDRAANAITGGVGGVAAATVGTSRGTGQTVSAIFDTEAEAQRAVADLRSAGVSDSALSVIARSNGTTTARDVDGEITDEHHESIARGVLGGGALGAGLGVLALAIPGVGPLIAAGAIAASAVPGAMAIGAVAGAAAGTFNEVLKGHGISDEDASYYGEHLTGGGVLVTVDAAAANANVSDILRRNGGHSVNNPRVAAL
ncbi:hypothetical protein ASE90_10595 [Sphingomonas sp. Leaf67]|uniref:hypothetical protein n=1 Tax=Sphingomonas sp. Leaf67 TaxID=1736230 RepID=UPI0006FDCC9E|nr:hypothetical protein [Sphingomonas sp. Leaf67]KQN82134.1 hypothetical protein ASE90_10595 [Sphingomonas sp. Leaf67]